MERTDDAFKLSNFCFRLPEVTMTFECFLRVLFIIAAPTAHG